MTYEHSLYGLYTKQQVDYMQCRPGAYFHCYLSDQNTELELTESERRIIGLIGQESIEGLEVPGGDTSLLDGKFIRLQKHRHFC